MERIPWETFNATDFQTYCNALLSFEISKTYVPFNAPGKDTGIDGKFDGHYNGHDGQWRFQFKFHKTARKQAFTSLKAGLKNELNKIGHENNFILLTNIDLLPQEKNELNSYAASILHENNKKETFFDVWDDSQLFNITLRYPILKLWLEEKFTTAQLQEYKKGTFEKSENLNFFAGRESLISQLTDFLTSDKSFCLISGEAGIGKTRLCTEFFNTLEENNDWKVLVLAAFNIDFDKINFALSGNKNYVIYIDDAHQYSSEVIADFYRISTLERENKIKVILTARSIFQEYKKFIKDNERNRISKIVLEKLSKEDTQKVLANSLRDGYLSHYIDDLVIISRGRPILISAVVNASKTSIPIGQIKKDSFIKEYVNDYFDSFIELISQETGEQKGKLKNLLWIICLIEPIPLKNAELKKVLSENEQLGLETIDLFIENLTKYDVATGRSLINIKPDYYSDIYLNNVNSDWIERNLQKYAVYTHNIIENLVAIEEALGSQEDKRSAIDTIIELYIQKISSAYSITELESLLKTIDYVAYAKPELALKAVTEFISIFDELGNPISLYIQNEIKIESNLQRGCFASIKSILYQTSYHETHFHKVIDLLITLYKLTKDKTIFNRVIGFSKRDAVEHYDSKLQLHYLNQIALYEQPEENGIVEFIVSSYKDLLHLSFTVTSSSPLNRYSLNIVTYYVHETEPIKELRLKIISNAIGLFYSLTELKNKQLVLDLLLDIPREISATKRNKTRYAGISEIEKVLEFLTNFTSGDMELAFQQQIHEKLYWYKRWKILTDIDEKVLPVENNLVPKKLSERLIKLFTRTAEDVELDFKKLEEKFYKEANEIIDSNNEEDIFSAIQEIIQNYSQLPSYLANFLQMLANDSKKAERIVEIAFEKDLNFVKQWVPSFLKALYFQHDKNDVFWNYINTIYSWDSVEGYKAILFVYHYLHEDAFKRKITQKDVDLITNIFHKDLKETYHYLAYCLPCILNVSEKEAQDVLGSFLNKCSQTNADNLIFFIQGHYKDCFATLKHLILHHTQRFAISYYIESALQEIVDTDWPESKFDNVFKYLLERHSILMARLKNGESYLDYDFVPFKDTETVLQNRTKEEKEEIFRTALAWFISQTMGYSELYQNKGMLSYLQPSNYVNSELKSMYSQLILEHENSPDDIYKIASSLEIFHDKNEEMLQLIAQIIDIATATFDSNSEIYREIQTACYLAIITVGGKSGTAGQPFQVDLDMQKFLNEQLAFYENSRQMTKVLNSALRSFETDINHERLRDEDEW